MADVLLIEDDPGIREGLALGLGHLGHRVRSAPTAEEGLTVLRGGGVDVVVLDLMLPGIDGFEACRRIRGGAQDVPVVMLTARGDDVDVVAGLEAGADDYVVKPVRPRVLDARIKTVLRRIDRAAAPEGVRAAASAAAPGTAAAAGTAAAGSAPAGDGQAPAGVDVHRDLAIDRAALTVSLRGAPVALTPIELRLLLVLAGSPRQVFSRPQLLRSVWEQDHLGDSRLVDACVQRLRAKIEDDTAHPAYLQTVRGFGYRFGPV